MINLSGLSEKFSSLTLYSIDGKQHGVYTIEGSNVFKLNVQSLQKGVYLLHLKGNDLSKSVRFIKE
ncbi:T9SS type A sorting domain-containing protein [Flammeovirga pectinis]|uniref:T9SS type A sorting domain-containing protein n=2 Tax=Flammeovirga pectinis TaxID=2494373 RepID=A0A3Q9FR97_9BACT|nr:T9SS type A sorting domain-containing protein [Flammeovirga pectinis]